MTWLRRCTSLAAALICGGFLVGCDNSTNNEEGFLKGEQSPVPVDSPKFSTFGEYQKYQSELSKQRLKEKKSRGRSVPK